MTETVGVFGGSFDPPHCAHVLAVSYALASYPLDAVWIVPTFAHALGKTAVAPFEARCAMARLAFARTMPVQVLELEASLPVPSRTLYTLEALTAAHPNTGLRLIVGSDLLADVHRWHRFEDVVRLAPPLVLRRAGYEHVPNSYEALPLALPRIASRDVREALRRGEDLRGMIPLAVLRYAQEHGFYS